MSSKDKVKTTLCLLLFGLILSVGLMEIILRVIDFSYPSLHRLNKTTGGELLPGAEGWSRKEGEQYIKINKDGMRGQVFEKSKPIDTVRIAVLGDSFAEGFQVSYDNTFPSILKNALDECKAFGEKKVEVINFGVGGYGTAQELLALRERVWSYDPDIVLLAMFLGNDIRNNSVALEGQRMRPFFILRNGELVLDDSFRYSKEFKVKTSLAWRAILAVAQYSRIVQLLNKARHNLGSTLRYVVLNAQLAKQDNDIHHEGYKEALFEPINKVWAEAWLITEKLLLRMRDEIRQKGKKFIIVTLSTGIQVHPDFQVRENFIENIGVADLLYPDRRINEFALKNEIPNIMLAPRLATHALKTGEFLHGFKNSKMGVGAGHGHWNENGHRLGGHLIAEKFCGE